jgi:phosphoglycerol transferase MdoB-like AlkP superfamily enzyme
MFVAISLIKVSYLSVPLVFYDLFQIDDLLLNLESINIYAILFLIVLVCVLVVAIVYASYKSRANKYRLFSFLSLILIVVILNYTTQNIKRYFSSNKIKYKWNSNTYINSQKYGLVTFFIQSIYFSNKLEKPDHYTQALANKYLIDDIGENYDYVVNPETTPDNVIVLLVESFQNIKELPWKANIEITPTYNTLELTGHSGKLISPVFGGKSINAEFELLTSFSSMFNPIGSIPYKDFIHHKVPSLAWQFKQNNYTTNAIQVVEMKGYGYSSIYKYLGFDNKFSLSRLDKKITLDPTKRFGSSDEISTKISELIKTQDKSFIFAFPNSSHSPWKIKDYPDNKVKLLNNNLNKDLTDEIIAYYNAIKHVDDLFKNLKKTFDNNEKTIILIIGDHQPALKVSKKTPQDIWSIEDKINNHLVPYLFWSNYEVDFMKKNEKFTSMNFIGLTLLKYANIKPKGFYAFLDNIKQKFAAFSFVLLEEGEIININDMKINKVVEKYQLVQYKYLTNDEN